MKNIAIAISAVAFLAGCEATYTNHGFTPQVVQMDGVKAGADTRGSILRKLGRPSAYSSFDSRNWYYVASRVEHYAMNAPKVIDRKVVAIRFDDKGLVTSVNRYGYEDGQVLDLVTRRTPTYGREITALQQIFGNLGRVSAEQVTSPTGRPGG
jgi:outer membrane protein assembly factor BamE (lipoprotein component of BamABCDE complex)